MLFGSDFFGHSHFYKLPFFATDLFRFFLATVIFIRFFFIVHCLVQIFLAPVIFIRCIFFNCFAPIFLATVILNRNSVVEGKCVDQGGGRML